MITYRQGDIVLVSFPFTDLSHAKRRPALVVSADWYNLSRLDFVLVAITSMIPKKLSQDEWILSARDAQKAGLLYESLVKTGKIFTLEQALVIRKLGKLPKETTGKIASLLVGVFNNTST